MKLRNAAIALMACTLASASFSSFAATSHAELSWVGDGGYRVEGTFSYDDTVLIVSGNGAVPTTGLLDLAVSFYDPAHNLLFNAVNVANGVSSYDYLNVSFDTVVKSFTGDFDMGQDSQAGDLHLAGVIGSASDIFNFNGDSVDSISGITAITVTAVPLPAAAWLFGSALAGLGMFKRGSQKML